MVVSSAVTSLRRMNGHTVKEPSLVMESCTAPLAIITIRRNSLIVKTTVIPVIFGSNPNCAKQIMRKACSLCLVPLIVKVHE